MPRPEDSGSSAVEYGLLIAAIVIVVVVSIGALGTQILNLYETIPNPFP